MVKKIINALALLTLGLIGLSICAIVFMYVQQNKRPPEDLPDIYTNTTIPNPPGIDNILDKMWTACATANQRSVCDELSHVHHVDSEEYHDFGSSCGGRIEILYPGVDCSKQLALKDNPPTILVLPWDMEIERLCLNVSETYTSVDSNFTPIHNSLVKLLRGIIGNGDKNAEPHIMITDSSCEATLEISIQGTALSEGYIGLEGRRYTGAEIRGEIKLSANGQETLVSEIYRNREPLDELLVTYPEGQEPQDPGYKTPQSAPFCSASEDQIFEAFNAWFGAELGREQFDYNCR